MGPLSGWVAEGDDDAGAGGVTLYGLLSALLVLCVIGALDLAHWLVTAQRGKR